MRALEPERRSQLLAGKLTVLAREHLSLSGEPASFPGGAALRAENRQGAVLAEADPARSLGRALAWARQAGVERLHLLVEDQAGLLARRATVFATPPEVWWVRGRELHPVSPEPWAPGEAPAAEALALGPSLVAAGADLVVEHGVVAGEVLGLEVARVVIDPDDGAHIEAGVGRHDREAFSMLHGDLPTDAALAAVIGSVRAARNVDAPDHPLRRLASERWLREVVIARPALVGAIALERHEGPVARPNVKEPWPAVALGAGPDGEPIVVVTSIGIDLDLVPFAADARLAAGDAAARLVLVVPERDGHPVTRALAASLRHPAEVVTVPGDWRTLGSG